LSLCYLRKSLNRSCDRCRVDRCVLDIFVAEVSLQGAGYWPAQTRRHAVAYVSAP
jgi:hypothetical protein